MIHLKINGKKVQWSIIAGIFLLIFAFFIIFTSSNNKASENQQNTMSKDVENKVITSDISTQETISENAISTSEETTSEIISQEATSENISEKTTASNIVEETTSQQSAKDLIDFDAKYPFMIRVNRAENFAVVYGMDKNGRHTIPYKSFICSTGKEAEYTPLGIFEMSDKYRWRLMVDGTYAQYAIRIKGQIMLHSVPYLEPSSDTLEYWEYNKLGKPASLGCVRFRAAAIKWIYNNCKSGTKVNIYSKENEKPPIPLKNFKKIKKSNPNANWDPTDSDKDNPWNIKKSKKIIKKTKKSNKETKKHNKINKSNKKTKNTNSNNKTNKENKKTKNKSRNFKK